MQDNYNETHLRTAFVGQTRRSRSHFWSQLIFLCFGVLLVLGCSSSSTPVFRETDEPDYRRGKRLLNQGEREQALLSFLKVIDARNDAAQSHLEAGILYLETMNEPILAIYHFTRFLELRPDAREANQVTGLIDTAKKEFARTLPGRPFDTSSGDIDMMEVVERLRAENNRLMARLQTLEEENRTLRRTMERARTPNASTSARPESPGGGTQASTTDRYQVQSGDTLSSISRTVYGTSGRWEEIFEANRDQLRSPNDLRVGQTLRIPR